MGNVVKLAVAGTPVSVVIESALDRAAELSDVVIIGLSKGGAVSIASSNGDIQKVIGLTTQAQYRLCGISRLVNR